MWEPWNLHLPLLTGIVLTGIVLTGIVLTGIVLTGIVITTSSANSRESLIDASDRRNAQEPSSGLAVNGSTSGHLQPAVLFRQLFK